MGISVRDQKKLLDGGFGLYRLELEKKTIKITRTPGSWRTYRKYPTKKECQEAWDFLMVNPIYIEG